MTGKNTNVKLTNPDCRFYTNISMILYVNFHFNEKFIFMTENGNVKQIFTCFCDVAGNTIVIL